MAVPFTKKSKLGEKLNLLESQGIIEKVQYSKWAAPIVAVDKPDGGVRICGDFKITVNPELEVEKHQKFPKPSLACNVNSLNCGLDKKQDQCNSLGINYRRLKYAQSATYHAEYLHVQVLINYANKYQHIAYLKMKVAEECRHILTVNTHQGLYQYRHVVFGIASAPALWQKARDQVLQGIPGTQCILIT